MINLYYMSARSDRLIKLTFSRRISKCSITPLALPLHTTFLLNLIPMETGLWDWFEIKTLECSRFCLTGSLFSNETFNRSCCSTVLSPDIGCRWFFNWSYSIYTHSFKYIIRNRNMNSNSIGGILMDSRSRGCSTTDTTLSSSTSSVAVSSLQITRQLRFLTTRMVDRKSCSLLALPPPFFFVLLLSVLWSLSPTSSSKSISGVSSSLPLLLPTYSFTSSSRSITGGGGDGFHCKEGTDIVRKLLNILNQYQLAQFLWYDITRFKLHRPNLLHSSSSLIIYFTKQLRFLLREEMFWIKNKWEVDKADL